VLVSNDSSTGGYIKPTSGQPLEDADLEDFFQTMLVGLTGLPGALVRPRWQPTPPKQPEPDVDWCAFGVTPSKPDAGPAIIHDGTGTGRDIVQRHEELELMCSFYGPHGSAIAALARDGAAMPQNNGMLRAGNMSVVRTGEIRAAPDLVNQQWVRRYDMTITVRRQIQRIYPTLNFESAEVRITTDTGPSVDVVS